MRIVTWNCFRGGLLDRVGDLEELGAEIVVFQECGLPEGLNNTRVVWSGENEKQGLGVYVKEPFSVRPMEIDSCEENFVLPVEISGEESFTLLVLWVHRRRKSYPATLQSLLEANHELLAKGECIVIGDFNVSPALDVGTNRGPNARVLRTLQDEGYISAYHSISSEPLGQESQATHYHLRKRDRAFHIDYCFVPMGWWPRVRAVVVGEYERWIEKSDHMPLFVEFDEKRFTEEQSRRSTGS